MGAYRGRAVCACKRAVCARERQEVLGRAACSIFAGGSVANSDFGSCMYGLKSWDLSCDVHKAGNLQSLVLEMRIGCDNAVSCQVARLLR
jgi:hypothetical protein